MEEETIARVIADLEKVHHQQAPISHSTLQDLQSLSDSYDSSLIDQLYEHLAARNLSPSSSLLAPISAAMDSGTTIALSLSASKLYLSLLLSPNSPVFTLFTPMAFLSLLRSLRRSLKPRAQEKENPPGENHAPVNQRRKGGKRGQGLKNNFRDMCSNGNENDDGDEAESGRFDVKVFLAVLERLVLVIGSIHLDRFPDSLKAVIQTVAEMPVTSVEMLGSSSSYNRLLDFCSLILSEVLKCENGGKGDAAGEVLKSLTPLVLMGKSQARTFALGFVTKKMVGIAKESDGVKKAVVNLPRYLVHKAPEKAEPRSLAVEAMMEIIKAMDFEDQIAFVEYVVKMTQGKTNLRLLAVDLILMLMMSLSDTLELDSVCETTESWGLSCLEALIQRCSDVNGGIRARALANLAQLVSFLSSDDRNKVILKEVMGFVEARQQMQEGRMNDLLRKRCMDEKAAVRKAALLLVTKLTALLDGSLDGVLLKTIGMACSDPLVSIRKAAISALSEAFKTSCDGSVITEWLHSVPRLIADNESSIQEECEKLFSELVLDRVSLASVSVPADNASVFCGSSVKAKSLENNMRSLFPEGVLVLLEEMCNGEVMPWVKKICKSLGKKKGLKPKIVIALQNIIKTSESIWLGHLMPIEKWTAPAGAWFLLSEVSTYLPKAIDLEFLYYQWKLLDKHEIQGELNVPLEQVDFQYMDEDIESTSVAWTGDRVFLLQTISNVSMEMRPEPAADLAHNLLMRIEDFNMHSTEVNAHVKALRTLCNRKASSPEEAERLVMKWVHQLLSKASQILESYMSDESKRSKDSSLFTPLRRESRKGKEAANIPGLLSQATTAVYTIGSLVVVCPSADMNSVVPLLHTIITSGNADPKLNKLPGPAVSFKQKAPSLHIQAWLTMGKICLANGKVAKRYIPLFVQELEKSDSAALRNNLVVMMADFCVRYTALVDCYMSKISTCLRDPCELVRRQTFILLSRLLQRDYVKWRGVLFLRFLLSLVDESEKIRQLADYLFGHILKAKAPLLAYNCFVEAVFVLNNCTTHGGHGNSKVSSRENRLFSIRGNDGNSRSKRMQIYACLLKQMAPEHLLATFAKLCAEILAAASDGMLNIEDVTCQSVLQDTFQILGCNEIRVQSSRGQSTDMGDIEDEGGDGGSAARGRAINQAVRKGIIQNTIPIFIELKRLLESKNSPLTGSLMDCLRIILKDYKSEIDDILVADKQLQKELVYDMQKYESAKARSTAAEAVATANSGSYRSPPAHKVASGMHELNDLTDKLPSDSRVASAMADAAAEATVRSVLREVSKGASTPPLSSISKPKLKSSQGGQSGGSQPSDVLESLRRRQSFNSDDEN
ncbi:Condensin-2 complex subunit D3 isoform 1 [Tripterygium wilfordii]|uniref:Condensin-2 complex subunit D3 isoform 1 n=1 Tax=Tripterygium wilfordii TaxID=458696 RepID=A0A7J7CX57_TRIWF|nr:condensin-2 complex subunit D3 isoform X2 [Tripterygium wilfordii]KAF5738722.1 Condensin-2 complex subunit D3 isoform 1 [Tripterygium wilfordii]